MSRATSFGLREARLEDCDRLVDMMAVFYEEANYPLNRQRAHAAFTHVLQNSGLGRVWIIVESGEDVGYIVLTMSFSMEYGGMSAFVDDFYIRLSHRGRGLGHRTLESVKTWAGQAGVRAIHLEVGRDNGPGQAVYRRAGFTDNDRQLLTVQLSDPTHVA
ncbi:MAG TPA: GNAT family N-acetyltransferase [Longimicrobiales bacterium]|nr:GNAT family N-acetyltransferase [Longimicrobiales bacterium]